MSLSNRRVLVTGGAGFIGPVSRTNAFNLGTQTTTSVDRNATVVAELP